MKYKIFLAVVAVLIIIQFFTIDKTNPPVDKVKDFIAINNPPSDIKNMIKNSCYDCHSHETKYPWYTNVAPLSWLIKSHINDGRKHLNFSLWSEYDSEKQTYKLKECIEEIKEGEMPMKAYLLLHSEAELSDEQKDKLVNWFQLLKQ